MVIKSVKTRCGSRRDNCEIRWTQATGLSNNFLYRGFFVTLRLQNRLLRQIPLYGKSMI